MGVKANNRGCRATSSSSWAMPLMNCRAFVSTRESFRSSQNGADGGRATWTGSPKGEFAGANESNALQFLANATHCRFTIQRFTNQRPRSHESSNRTNRGVQGAVRGNGLEPGEKSVRAARGDWSADREVFRKAEVCSTSAPEISSHFAEVRRDHAIDDLDLYPDVGLAISGAEVEQTSALRKTSRSEEHTSELQSPMYLV